MINWPKEAIRTLAVCAILLMQMVSAAWAARVPAGTYIGSAATLNYEIDGFATILTIDSNIPLIQIQPRRTPSRLTLHRLSASDTIGDRIEMGDVAFLPNALDEEAFVPQIVEGFDPTEEIRVIRTDSFLPGDIIFFHLRDEGLNHMPDVVETITITMEGANGDEEVFQLSAAGPDSSDFYGYALATSEDEATPGDGQLATVTNQAVTVTYEDEFDTTDSTAVVAVVDPTMMVFDALSGDPVDGATARVIDTNTGNAVAVYGTDGMSMIGMSVKSGLDAADSSGRVYPADAGELRLPYLAAGTYRIQLDPPAGYVFSSDTPDAVIAALPNASYRLLPGSRGGSFDMAFGGTPAFDIPVDPKGSLILTKTADDTEVAIGDLLRYRLTIENNDDRDAANLVISDGLPFGFRFLPGSLRLDGAAGVDPQIGTNGTDLSFAINALASGERLEITYIAEVTAAARFGSAKSIATGQGPQGFRSNAAESFVTVTDALLSRYGTVLGRVVVGECNAPETEGARVRLLMETADVITTDADGRFHIDGLDNTTHVLRLDEYSLPDNLVPHSCPADLREGDTATTRTIETKGGLLRDVIFRLRRIERAEDITALPEPVKKEIWTEERLTTLNKELQIVYPANDASMDDPSLTLGVAYPFGQRVAVSVNGVPVSGLSALKTLANRQAGVAMRRWRGIDLPDGPSLIEATILDANGSAIARVEHVVHYVTEPAKATVLPEQSTLIADGQTPPKIAIRITDDAGRAVHTGRRIPLIIAPPYQSAKSFARFADDPLAERDATRSAIEVGPDGIAMVELRPTTRAGEVSMNLQFPKREADLRAWISPAPRPWVLVGVADGTVGYNTIDGNMVSAKQAGLEDEIFSDGRMAFYAKGAIRGDWLLTLAYDSDKSRNPRENDLFDQIDPNAYYPVYGDASTQEQIAPSRYPLYVRLERGQFFAMFGDYNTGLNRTQLAAYDRRLSGFKSVYEGDRFQVVAFAAEADQQFQRAEFAADIGVGPYVLGVTDILRNSETVKLVIREREGLDTVISEQVLARFVDYSIDYATGEVILQRAPDPTDDDFNPAFIVVDFETDAADPGTITAGGRAAVKLLDDKIEIGATAIHEEGGAVDTAGDLLAVDARVNVTDSLELTGEVAGSRMREDGVEREGMGYRAEGVYTREGWRARIYIQQADSDFGIAQQSVATQGRRTYGAEIRAEIADPLAKEGDAASDPYAITGKIFRDDDLDSAARRDEVEALISRRVEYGSYGKGTAALGLRRQEDRLATGETRETSSVVGRAEARFLDGKAGLTLERNQTIESSGTATPTPNSTLARVDALVMNGVRATAGIEVFDGEEINEANIKAGLSADVWTGGRVDLGVNGSQGSGESGERLAATLGVAQDVKLSENLSVSMRVDHTQDLAKTNSPVARSQFATTSSQQEATNASIGFGYTQESWSASARVDAQRLDTSMSQRFAAAATGDITDSLTLAAAADLSNTDRDLSESGQAGSMTIGAAYRPAHRRFSALHRLRASFDTAQNERVSFVNTLTVQGEATQYLTVAGAYGIRYRLQEFDEGDYESITQFLAADAYVRLTQGWNLGIHGDTIFSLDGDASYAYGASLGYSPRDGVTIRAGYNFAGFEDNDFSDANITTQGPYLRLTVRFDEADIRSILPNAGWLHNLTAPLR